MNPRSLSELCDQLDTSDRETSRLRGQIHRMTLERNCMDSATDSTRREMAQLGARLEEAKDIAVERDREIVRLVTSHGDEIAILRTEIAALKSDLESAEDAILEHKESGY